MLLSRYFILVLFAITAHIAMADANDPQTDWAQVRIPVACIRDGKSNASEMTSQVIMGTPLQILEDDVEWLRIKAPDGYEGYVNISSLVRKNADEMNKWRETPRLVSNSLVEVKVYSRPDNVSSRDVVSELVLSSIVEGQQTDDCDMVEIYLPDGRKGYVNKGDMTPIADWADQELNMDSIIDTAYWLKGTPYLWGACSTKSVDCSGLVRVAYFNRGILTLRDARQQINIGKRIEPDDIDGLQRGDLLFFSNTPDGRISHVAIYDCDGVYIHSSGMVKNNRMSADDPDFSKRYYRGASRIKGMENTEGIVKVINHPWYFDQLVK